jgi:dinuclear metal center YbgI/SA1388 family protein
MSLQVRSLMDAMERIAPLSLAEPWDNVGLVAGSAAAPLSGVVLTIDLTSAVLAEASARGASAIVAYHPPIWEALKRVTDESVTGRLIVEAIAAGIAIYSPHTALDGAPGGMNDWLAEAVTLDGATGDLRALDPHVVQPGSQQLKVVTYVPDSQLDRLREAMASAGAGIIGAYRVCSFASPGTGTFFGDETTDPSTGESGRLERVGEHRLEMVCSRSALALVVETIRGFHPYEEPAIDVYELVGEPRRGVGAGRRVVLDRPVTLEEMASRVRSHLGVRAVKLARVPGMDGPITHVGVCPGSGGALVDRAIADGCQLYLTGEMRYHEVTAAIGRGLSIMLAGHTSTERGFMPRLRDRLAAELGKLGGDVEVVVADADRPRVELL